eukprot:CAMPEP_0168732170 /NCGR_PEP_ID=MMETSP0724-20121128/7637_1 /TAXON_ID=265536 /ORGANISM="Amphiprora sp., Strain CCMP467" /LENGTH=368 /DNA_ID=CAMNT_0008779189 /DNA_START=46 /DNA_END=1152 /DNA_ORIENTATION=+
MTTTTTFRTALVLFFFLLSAPTQAFEPMIVPPRTTAARQIGRTRPTNSALQSSSSNANELFPMQRGSTVAMITPYDKDTGKVNIAELEQLLQLHIQSGTKNLCILGTTGEANVVTAAERTLILKTAVDHCKGKMTILAGTGTINPDSVKSATLEALDLGCDASLVVTPYYVKPPQRYLVQHFLTAAEYGLPVVLYNVPGRTAVNMDDDSIALCAQHDNIVALKDATGDVSRLHSLKDTIQQQTPSSGGGDSSASDFLYYSGDDGTTMDFCLQGGDGCISVTANVAPAEMAQLMEASLSGDTARAKAMNAPLELLHQELFCEANPIPTKYALQKMGLIGSDFCRPPLGPMDAAAFGDRLETALRQAGKL